MFLSSLKQTWGWGIKMVLLKMTAILKAMFNVSGDLMNTTTTIPMNMTDGHNWYSAQWQATHLMKMTTIIPLSRDNRLRLRSFIVSESFIKRWWKTSQGSFARHPNIELSFWLFVSTSLWSIVWRVASLINLKTVKYVLLSHFFGHPNTLVGLLWLVNEQYLPPGSNETAG